jgi:hypothetical protein
MIAAVSKSVDPAEVEEFERKVAAPRRWVGLALAGLGALGLLTSAFLRVQVSLGGEQWASAGSVVVWTGVVAVALLLGEVRAFSGRRQAAVESMAEASRPFPPLGVVGTIALVLIAASADCELAHVAAHPVKKLYPTLVQLRFDADSGVLLFGVVFAATVRWRK